MTESESESPSLAQRLAIMLPVAITFLVLDQWSKAWATTAVQGHPPRTYAGIFTLVYAENFGAWGSLGASWGENTRWFMLGIFPAIVLAGLAIYALREKTVSKSEVLACGLIVAGGAGNLIDRFELGYVQDFLYVGYGPIGTNIFNIADAVVMAGLGILLWKNFQSYRAERREAKSKAS